MAWQFVELDAPFLLEERRARVERLREMMDRADVAVSEVLPGIQCLPDRKRIWPNNGNLSFDN